ncbi:autotransporter outer membrane beta-barrel domain-containing protein, partial [Cronobacter sakazakii]
MDTSKTFRMNVVTKLIRNIFPLIVLSSPVMANAETIISKDTSSSYIVSGDTDYIVNPDVTMSSSKTKPAVSVQGEDIVTFTNNGTIKNDYGNAMQVEIDGQSSDMFTLQNKGTISSVNTGISVTDAQNVTLVNTGTISGNDYAISFENDGNNALVLKAGSSLGGDVITTGSANTTITLNDSGNEDSNFTGANEGDGFKSLTMDGSDWTLTGNVDLTGEGDSLIVKTGNLTLGGDVKNSGATLINDAASLQIGTGTGDNASLEGNVTNNGTLIFNQAADYIFAGDISGTGNLVKEDANTLTLTGNNSFSGDTTLKGGTTLVAENATMGPDGGTGIINIDSGATFASAGTVNSSVAIAAGGVLASWNAVSGNENASTPAAGNTINGDVTNQGTLQIAGNNSVGNAFTINGNYTGDENSRIVMNTEAGADSSPTDHLAITGNSAGSSSLEVANIGGQGAQTINGIELISVGGASDASFTLGKPVVAGMWEYDLYKHNDGNWYLESKASDTP